MLVLAHFKGHPMGGYGGALKQLSIGCASSAGKALIHSGGVSTDIIKCWDKHAEQDRFCEAMADAAVKEGIPRVYAYEMAAQSVLGSALMVLSSGTHPAALKDAVCSPGGTTIEAVEELERKGFRAAIMDAMDACARKSRELSKQ